MADNIFLLRERMAAEDRRNLVIEDDGWSPYGIEVIPPVSLDKMTVGEAMRRFPVFAFEFEDGAPRCDCGNLLTIVDYHGVCRECATRRPKS